MEELNENEFNEDKTNEEKERKTEINIWEGEGGNIGHASVRTKEGTYVSIWPNVPMISPKQILFNMGFSVKARSKTLIEDATLEATEFRSPNGEIIRNRIEADGLNIAQDTGAVPIPRIPKRISLNLSDEEEEIVEKNAKSLNKNIENGKIKYCIANQTEDCLNCIGGVKEIFKGTNVYEKIPKRNFQRPKEFGEEIEKNLNEGYYKNSQRPKNN